MTANIFYVYYLIDPRSHKPFYVGKGCDKRYRQHITEARGDPTKWTNRIKCQIINSIERCNLKVIFQKIQDNLMEEDAFRLETDIIAKHGRLLDGTGCLSNISLGNQQPNQHIGKPVISYTYTGAIVSSFKSLASAARSLKIHKSSICAALNGRCAMAGGYRWSYVGEPVSMLPSGRYTPVSQFSLEGRHIRDFSSVNDAAQSVCAIFSQIADCCAHRRKTAKGFMWTYKGELPVHKMSASRCRSVQRTLVCSLDGQTLKSYKSIKEASADTNIHSSGICDAAAGRKHSAGGFSWTWIVA